MGGGSKLAMKFGGKPIVRLAAETLAKGGVDALFAVVGPGDSPVYEALSWMDVTFVVNDDPAAGMASSLNAGIGALGPEYRLAVVMPGDMPKVRGTTVAALLNAVGRQGKSIAAPTYAAKRGNPVAFDLSRHRSELSSLEGDKGGRDILAANPSGLAEVAVDDPGVLVDVDTQEDLRALSDLRSLKVLVRGAGEMATGIAHRLFRSGFSVAMTEIAAPLAVRRKVSFCEAVYDGKTTVEGVRCLLVPDAAHFSGAIAGGAIPLAVDPELHSLADFQPDVLIDATIAKRNLGLSPVMAPLVIAFGPGFSAPEDAHVVVETNRGHDLGRLIYDGSAEPDTGAPAPVLGHAATRVLRAPADGPIQAEREIGDAVAPGDVVARVGDTPVHAEISGVLRGLVRSGIGVRTGMKIGDVDPNGVRGHCFTISDKARALGGGALEAILAAFNR